MQISPCRATGQVFGEHPVAARKVDAVKNLDEPGTVPSRPSSGTICAMVPSMFRRFSSRAPRPDHGHQASRVTSRATVRG